MKAKVITLTAFVASTVITSSSIGSTWIELAKEGAAAYRRGQYDLSISRYTAALQAKPEKSKAALIYASRADSYNSKDDHNRAMQDSNAAIELNPQFFGGYAERGRAYEGKREYDKAIADYDQSIRLNPKVGYVYYNRGNAYAKKGNEKKAIQDYDEAIRRDPKDADFRFNRAQSYMAIGRLEEALAGLNEAIRLNPKDPDAYSAKADLFAGKGDYERASLEYRKAVQLFPDNVRILGSNAWFRATCPEESARDGKKAVEYARKACELTHWRNWRYLATLAAACAEAGDFEQAIKYQTQVLARNDASGEQRNEMKQLLALYQNKRPYREEVKR